MIMKWSKPVVITIYLRLNTVHLVNRQMTVIIKVHCSQLQPFKRQCLWLCYVVAQSDHLQQCSVSAVYSQLHGHGPTTPVLPCCHQKLCHQHPTSWFEIERKWSHAQHFPCFIPFVGNKWQGMQGQCHKNSLQRTAASSIWTSTMWTGLKVWAGLEMWAGGMVWSVQTGLWW
jgi:hypothetical protein